MIVEHPDCIERILVETVTDEVELLQDVERKGDRERADFAETLATLVGGEPFLPRKAVI